jgi:hypothetical protein
MQPFLLFEKNAKLFKRLNDPYMLEDMGTRMKLRVKL